MKHRFVPLAALFALALAACPVEPTEEPVTGSHAAVVEPGGWAAVSVDLASGQVVVEDSSPALSADALAAIDAAPAWIQGRLRVRLGMVDEELQDVLAALILEAPEDRVVDEIAFSIANLTELDLARADFDPALITENALAVYEYADRLAYAEIVDFDDDADGRSTVRYAVTDASGAATTVELAPDDYYWWVVHPKIDYEAMVPVDPATGLPAAAPDGVHWRRYLWESSTDTFDYRDHFILREPTDLRGEAWDLAASAHLEDPLVYPIRLFVDEAGNGLLAESDVGSGTILASTLDYAWGWADDGEELLANVSGYGNTNIVLRSYYDVALVFDEEPWGSNPYEEAIPCDVIPMTVAELAEADWTDFEKIIIASDQTLAFYEAVAALATPLEDFARDWGVLQLDLHTTADLSGLVFAGGVTVAGGPPADVLYEGQPLLSDLVTQAPVLWDSVLVEGASGDRPPPDATNAFDAIGWWATQNMFDNVSEYVQVTGNNNPERSWYPQRIVRNHYGNCGELGDLLAGAGRSALMAVRVIGQVEDHCWDEVLVGDRWVPWQVDWSDGATRIDNPGVGSDEDLGGGKTTSGIYSLRGDGLSFSSVELYSNHVDLEISIVDGDGRPVDGATVLLVTEAFYDASQLTLAGVTYSGSDGVARITGGDDRNFWIWVWSEVGGGADSDGDGDASTISVNQVVTVAEGVADALITETVELDAALDLPAMVEVRTEGGAVADAAGAVRESWIAAKGYYTDGRFLRADEGGAPVRWYLVNESNMAAVRDGNAFYALDAADDVRDLDRSDIDVPAGEPVWLVAANGSVETIAIVDLELTVRQWIAD
jgi:hypothetical protein